MSEPSKGTYALVLHLESEEEITVGKLGTFTFPTGYYLYMGSALGPGGLEARLARHRPSTSRRGEPVEPSGHRRRDKKLHWHIDYLLEHAQLVEVWSAASTGKLECLWAQAARQLPGGAIPVPGFGSSDCRCPSHLIYLTRKPAYGEFEIALSLPHPNHPQGDDDARQVIADVGQFEAPAGDESLVELVENGVGESEDCRGAEVRRCTGEISSAPLLLSSSACPERSLS